MKTLIYTAIYGMKDRLHQPQQVDENTDYICFTEYPQKSSGAWKTVQSHDIALDASIDPCRIAKWYKMMPHCFPDAFNKSFEEYDRSIWIDANIELLYPITYLFEEMKKPEVDLAFFSHPLPHQDCIYGEASDCIRKHYDDPRLIMETVNRYKNAGHPPHWGLPMGRVIFRNHTKQIESFNAAWWKEVCEGTRRDQISLPVVLRNLGTPFIQFDCNLLYNHSRPIDNQPHHLSKIYPHQW